MLCMCSHALAAVAVAVAAIAPHSGWETDGVNFSEQAV